MPCLRSREAIRSAGACFAGIRSTPALTHPTPSNLPTYMHTIQDSLRPCLPFAASRPLLVKSTAHASMSSSSASPSASAPSSSTATSTKPPAHEGDVVVVRPRPSPPPPPACAWPPSRPSMTAWGLPPEFEGDVPPIAMMHHSLTHPGKQSLLFLLLPPVASLILFLACPFLIHSYITLNVVISTFLVP